MLAAPKASTFIAGLPDGLRYVPPAPSSPFAEDADAQREAWRAWAHALRISRLERRQQLKETPELIPYEIERCRRSAAYFVAMWGWLFEPRPEQGGGTKPWLPFEVQIRLIDWMDARMAEPSASDRDGIVSKARTLGYSWVTCAWGLHGWLFKEPWNLLYLSRSEEYVESNSSESLFWKIEFLLRNLQREAPWLLPEGFSLTDRKSHTHMTLINPANGNELLGESTNALAGIGGRYTAALIDESSLIRDLLNIFNGLAAATNHRFAGSSERMTVSVDHYQLGIGNRNPEAERPALFEMNWWDNPNNDRAWYEAEKTRYKNRPDDFRREIERDARAGGSENVYPQALDLRASSAVQLTPYGTLYASIDPGQRDDTAIVWLQKQGETYAVLGGYQNRGKEAAFYGHIMTGNPCRWVRNERGELVSTYRHAYDFTDDDLRFMEWTSELPQDYLRNFNVMGDPNGDNDYGLGDTVYGVLMREFGIFVNKATTFHGDKAAWRPVVRYEQQRVEALRQMLPHLAFSTEHNAAYVLECLQEARYATETGRAVNETKKALHDGTSHFRSAMEFWAGQLTARTNMEAIGTKRAAERARVNARDLAPGNPNRTPFGRRTPASPRRVAS